MKLHPIAAIALAVSLFATQGTFADDATLDFDLLGRIAPLGGSTAAAEPPADGPLLLQFWASWCHSCGALMWDMDEIVSRHEQLEYLAVSLDEDAEAAENYVRKLALAEKHAGSYFLDAEKALAASLGVETVPSILLVAPDGEVLVHKSGHLNSTDLHDLVSAIE